MEGSKQMNPETIQALHEALTYSGGDRPALVARIPVICNDIRWIKNALMGLYALLGTAVAANLIAKIFGL